MLSKSRFVAGIQCLKRLWNQWHRRDELPTPGPAQQALFDIGYEVGRLAHQLVPGGVLVTEDHMHHADARATTRRLMADPSVPAILEAAFTFEDIRIRVDILKRLPRNRWELLEVKSSTETKDCHRYDVAIQQYVLEGCGLEVAAAGLVHINNQYVYDGEHLDVAEFLILDDLTSDVSGLRPEVLRLLARERATLARPEPPPIPAGRHCHTPYSCEWWNECRALMPEFWVEDLPRAGNKLLTQLKRLGIDNIADIPDKVALNPLQRRVRDAVRSERMFVSPSLADAFDGLEYPIHYLDFETFMPCTPRYRGTRPYQTLPFQWSDHVLHQDGRLEHHEWLCNADRDPRDEFTEALLETLGESGTIIAWNAPYEGRILRELGETLPHLEHRLQAARSRLWDLLPVVRDHIYHREFHGSFSLKAVLPVLVPEMSYGALDVQEGSQAQLAYHEMIHADTAPRRKAQLKRQLLAYCGQDTMAMVRLHRTCLELGGEAKA